MPKQRPRKSVATRDTEVKRPPTVTDRPKSLVFISHDSRDAELAKAFALLLSDVSAGTLKSFNASDKHNGGGIEFGTEWYTSIMSQLAEATDVVALLTARSVERPWILYEAGVAKGKLDATVLGLAVDVSLEKVSTGPFGQFQNCAADEDSLTKLVIQLLRRNPDAAPREEAVRTQVRQFIATVQKISEAQPRKAKAKVESDDENAAKLFEEVKAMVRQLQDRLDRPGRHSPGVILTSGVLRVTHRVLNEVLDRAVSIDPKKNPNEAAVTWLLVVSLLRDAAPWAYEPGMELYRALIKKDAVAMARAQETIAAVSALVTESRWYEGIAGTTFANRYVYPFIRDLPRVLPRLADKYVSALSRKAGVESSERKS